MQCLWNPDPIFFQHRNEKWEKERHVIQQTEHKKAKNSHKSEKSRIVGRKKGGSGIGLLRVFFLSFFIITQLYSAFPIWLFLQHPGLLGLRSTIAQLTQKGKKKKRDTLFSGFHFFLEKVCWAEIWNLISIIHKVLKKMIWRNREYCSVKKCKANRYLFVCLLNLSISTYFFVVLS